MANRSESQASIPYVALEVDFDGLARLARDDPDAFEQERRRLIEACIAGAPAEDHAMLRRLQFRADGTRSRCHNALQSSLRLAEMMWTSFSALNARLNPPASAADPASVSRPEGSARILSLCRSCDKDNAG